MEKVSMNKLEMARRCANNGGTISPSVIEEMQAEITILGSQNETQEQDITDIKVKLSEIAHNYTEEEYKTGRKLGTKNIYQKLIRLDNPVILSAGTGGKVLDGNLNIDTLIDVKVFSELGISCCDLMTYEQENNIYMVSPYAFEVSSFIIEYTKAGV